MSVYLRAKFQVFSIFLTSFKKPTQIRVKVHTLEDSFTIIYLPYIYIFVCCFLTFGSSGQNYEFSHRECRGLINSKISFMSSGDQPILTLKMSVTNF